MDRYAAAAGDVRGEHWRHAGSDDLRRIRCHSPPRAHRARGALLVPAVLRMRLPHAHQTAAGLCEGGRRVRGDRDWRTHVWAGAANLYLSPPARGGRTCDAALAGTQTVQFRAPEKGRAAGLIIGRATEQVHQYINPSSSGVT